MVKIDTFGPRFDYRAEQWATDDVTGCLRTMCAVRSERLFPNSAGQMKFETLRSSVCSYTDHWFAAAEIWWPESPIENSQHPPAGSFRPILDTQTDLKSCIVAVIAAHGAVWVVRPIVAVGTKRESPNFFPLLTPFKIFVIYDLADSRAHTGFSHRF